jgi:hypothetical protein
MIGRHAFDRLKLINPGVIDKNVQFPVGLLGFLEELRYIFRLGKVGLYCHCFAAFVLNLLHHSVRAGLAAGIVHDNRGAFRSKMLRDGGADSFEAPVTTAILPCSLLIVFPPLTIRQPSK